MDTYIIYESKYGTTKDIAKNISMILGPAKYCTTKQWKDEFRDSEYIVIGTPVYIEEVNPKIYDFVSKNSYWLKQKKVFLFSVSLMKKGGERYLEPLKRILGDCVVSIINFGGRLVLDNLDNDDYQKMKNFTKLFGTPLEDVNLYNIEEIIRYGLSIRKYRDYKIKMPMEELKKYVEKYISEHKSCTLSTGYNNMVRGTPVDYDYYKGYIYILSEGGFKFANILRNDNVSMSIYETFHGMDSILGMQITGKAQIIEDESKEYIAYLDKRKINKEKLPCKIHLIKVEIDCVEMLSHELNEMGYGVKHYYKSK